MNALSTPLVWVCLLIVTLPLSPCAFLSSACCHREALDQARSVTTSERPCCAHHAAPGEQPARKHGKQPCQSECCRLSPFVPSVDKVLHDAPPVAIATLLPQSIAVMANPVALPSVSRVEDPPLQILHCQWRL